MIDKIIHFSIRNKLLVGLFTLLIIGWGMHSLTKIPIDAVPDITSNQVQIITTSQNLAAQEVEQFITYPVELAMANLPGVLEIRSISRFGLSVVTVVFEDEMGTYLPRQLVAENLKDAQENIGEGLGAPQMGPISTGLGEIYQYTLETEPGYEFQYDATELRTIQDWIVKRQLSMIPGVVEISSWGGYLKQYEVAIDPQKLNAYDLTLPEVFQALNRNNENTGGSYIEKGPELYYIRGKGLAKSFEDIRKIVIAKRKGIPVTVADVAEVGIGHAPRYGAATKDGEGETVIGIVMMLKGANSAAVIDRIKARVGEIQQTLPEGVVIKPFLDRTRLVNKTTSTVSENLLIGGLIVIFALVFLLGTFRSGLIVASVIPLSMLFALGMMNVFNVSANLMSLGALDFGIIVDGAVIIVEFMVVLFLKNFTQLENLPKTGRKEQINSIAFKASSQMMNAAIFGQIIILIVFIPVLTLAGIEGKMFRPMALTFGFAILGAMILCLTYVPMIASSLLFSKNLNRKTWGDAFMAQLEKVYRPVINKALKAKAIVAGGAVALFVTALFVFQNLGGEFIPQLDEGDFALETRMGPGTSLKEMTKNMIKLEAILLEKFPEIKTVVTKIGAGEIPTDPMPIEGSDIMVALKDKDQWTSAESKQELAEKMEEALSVLPGLDVEFSQPIEMRFNELMTGIKQDIAVKIYGEDLDVLQEKGNEASRIIETIRGAADVRVEQVVGLPQIVIEYRRNRLAEYGLSISELNRIISTAFAGASAGQIFEGEKRFDLVVRLQQKSRADISSIRNLYVPLSNGQRIPLSEVAEVSFEEAPAQVSRDNTRRRIVIGVNVRNRDTESLVETMQQQLKSQLSLPPGYFITFGGEFENLKRAQQRLSIVVPLALALIFVILLISLGSFKQTLLIYTAIPFAAVGGVFALWIREMPFSISAGVGFIALFGVAVLNGLVLISSLNDLKAEGVTDIKTRVKEATTSRLRPIFLTALTDILGFLPMALSTSSGAEVQRPLATVVIGGLFTATLLTLIVLPVLYSWLERPPNLIRRPALFWIILLCFAFPANAQLPTDSLPGISLQQAKQWASVNNPLLRAERLNVDKNEKLQKTAFNPSNTNVFYSEEEVPGAALDQQALGKGVTSLGVGQTFDFPTVYPARSRMLKLQTSVAENNYRLSEAEIARQASNAYFQWVNSWQKLRFYTYLDSLYADFEQAARIRYQTGETSRLEQLNANSKKQQVELQLEAARADFRSAAAGLERVANATLPESAFPRDSMLAVPQLLEVALAQTNIPLIALQEAQTKLADVQLALQKKQWLPGLNIRYAFQTVDGRNGFYSWQAGIDIPLFFGSQKAKVQGSQLELLRQKELLIDRQLQWRADYQKAVLQFDKWQRQIQYYLHTGLPLSDELLIGASVSFQSGAIDYVEYIQNISQAVLIRLNWMDALLQYNQSIIWIHYLTGKN